MRHSRLFSLLICFLITCTLTAQETNNPELLSLDRIFSKREFRTERFGPVHWLSDGGYTSLDTSSTHGGREVFRHDPATGSRTVLIPITKLTPPGTNAPLLIENYEFSKDKSHALIFTNSKKVWRANTRGDYWLIDLKSWDLHQLGGDAEPATLMFADFSDDGKKVAYVVKNNIFVENVVSHEIVQLTANGSATLINGTFDWVYEEEFGLRKGFKWSPDSKKIAFWQLDAAAIPDYHLINNTDTLYPKLIPIKYPKVGTTNSAARVGVVAAAGGETTWLSVPGDPSNNYIADMEWAHNSHEIILQRLNRLQNTNQVMLADAKTGAVKTIFTERDDAWLDLRKGFNWLADGKEFLWISERNGWRHVYVVGRDGGLRQVTRGEYDVISIVDNDEKTGKFYFMASPDNATQRYLYQARLDGKGSPKRLSPTNQPGTHSYKVSDDLRWAIHTYSTFESPPRISLISLPRHEVIRTLEDNQEVRDRLAALNSNLVEFMQIQIAEDVTLDAWMVKPPDFDPGKKYPLFFYVYGEPAGQTVVDRYSSTRLIWHKMLAQKGYLVASVDNRGTPAPRGRTWRKQVYGQIGVLASKDQAAAAKKLITTYPFIDAERVGIWGWSGGGSMTLNMLFRHPEIYHTGMSVAPVPNQRLYDTIYQERYMGLPEGNAEGFEQGSPITFAGQLQGNLLLVHGTGDDNVHYQGAELLVNELIKHNKQFSLMSYPNRSHSIREGENTTRHLYGLLTRYLMENLPPGPRVQEPLSGGSQ